MIEFQEAWNKCNKIKSAVKEEEAALLFAYASKDFDGIIVEVGAHLGCSTVLLAQVGKSVITIDPLIPYSYSSPGDPFPCKVGPTDAKAFKRNVKQYDNICWIRQKSLDVGIGKYGLDREGIGFLFLDGDHSFPAPKLDFLHFEKALLPGSYQGWHDWGTFKGVSQAVAELEQAGKLEKIASNLSMMITRVPNV